METLNTFRAGPLGVLTRRSFLLSGGQLGPEGRVLDSDCGHS